MISHPWKTRKIRLFAIWKPSVATKWQHYLNYHKNKQRAIRFLKSDSSFCFAQLHIFEFVLECFDHCIAEVLWLNLSPSLCGIKFRIGITPFIILFFGDFTVSVFFSLFCPSGKLNSYLTDIEQQAQDLFLRLVKDLAEKENVTEKLKSDSPILWVRKMNNIRNRATEIVNEQVIYS